MKFLLFLLILNSALANLKNWDGEVFYCEYGSPKSNYEKVKLNIEGDGFKIMVLII
jgi:hypothetical protein